MEKNPIKVRREISLNSLEEILEGDIVQVGNTLHSKSPAVCITNDKKEGSKCLQFLQTPLVVSKQITLYTIIYEGKNYDGEIELNRVAIEITPDGKLGINPFSASIHPYFPGYEHYEKVRKELEKYLPSLFSE